ncbi:uncharacterized protein LOC141851482 [Brevipalpus obovatus]|uniref:uncharacterized protein LOC141851482 n=1 Tax=Brevipalpus obovatus TaxID=246614 RepID=UPI003D9E00F5
MVGKLGRPDLFITLTCNPSWSEVTRNLHEDWKLIDSGGVDRTFSAGIPPDSFEFTWLRQAVLRYLVHGPCGPDSIAICMKNGSCSKQFPKSFLEQTMFKDNSFPRYRRTSTTDPVRTPSGKDVHNGWIVSYNPHLLLKFDAHINVEVCASIECMKYLFKYIFKGHDSAILSTSLPDEIENYTSSRYVSSPEAISRIFKFELHRRAHALVHLVVHLPSLQRAYSECVQEQAALDRATFRHTTLTVWFKLNQESDDAHQILYGDISEHYSWNSKRTCWTPRRIDGSVSGRIYFVFPRDIET